MLIFLLLIVLFLYRWDKKVIVLNIIIIEIFYFSCVMYYISVYCGLRLYILVFGKGNFECLVSLINIEEVFEVWSLMIG